MSTQPTDVVLRRRIERMIGVLAPLLDLLLAVGDRASRLLERDDRNYAPPRMAWEGESAPRGLRSPIVEAGIRDGERGDST
ncbi:MAG TPA: hypothetical protein VGH93_00860 [Solirubrobacteraceae bacterium]